MPIIGSLITVAIIVLGFLLILQLISFEQVMAGLGRLLLIVLCLLFTFSFLGMVWRSVVVPWLRAIEPVLMAGAMAGFVMLLIVGFIVVAIRSRAQ